MKKNFPQYFHIKNEENLNEIVDEVFATFAVLATLTDENHFQSTLLALKGDLGAGKTTFTKKLAAQLGIKENLTSPTFTILKRYEIQEKPEAYEDSAPFKHLIHIDAYRLAAGNELEKLGFKKLLAELGNLICLEWPEIVEDILPPHYIELAFEHDPTDPLARKVTLSLKM